MRKNVSTIILTTVLLFAGLGFAKANGPSDNENADNGVIMLDKSAFIEKIFDYENNKDWDYKGNKPAIVDFYADWCGPCRKLSPLLEEIQNEYNGKLQVYKVDTDKSRQLSAAFGIRSLPTIVFIPMDGEPRAVLGYVPKEQLTKMVSEILKVSK